VIFTIGGICATLNFDFSILSFKDKAYAKSKPYFLATDSTSFQNANSSTGSQSLS
jgi:hypothetical protein